MLRIRIRDPVPFWPQVPGSGIRNGFFSGSRIPNLYVWELSDNFLGKKFNNSWKTGPNFFLLHFKNKTIYNFVKFVATKKGLTNFFFTPLFSCCFWIRDPGSGIRDLGSGMGKNQDPGSGINIPDPPRTWYTWCLSAPEPVRKTDGIQILTSTRPDTVPKLASEPPTMINIIIIQCS